MSTTAPVAASAVALLVTLTLSHTAHAAARPPPQDGSREGLACAACHVGSEGGPLTALGRSYRWRMTPFDPVHRAHGVAAQAGSEETNTARRPAFGSWSGDASVFGQMGRTRSAAERASSTSLIEPLRLHGDSVFGDDHFTFDGEGDARSGHHSLDGGVDDDAVALATARLAWRGGDGTLAALGRQFVVVGAAARRIDGLDVRAPVGSADVELFGGVPSDGGFGGANGDQIVGGRLGTRLGQSLALGASGFYAKDAGDPSDVKGGIDVRWSPEQRFEVDGHVFYDWIADHVYDGRLHAVWTPSVSWQAAADWTHAVPALFLPKNSIFWVFSVDAYDETGLTVTRRFDERLSANVFGRHTAYDSGDHLEQFGAGVDGRYGPNGEDAVGAEAAYQDEARDDLGGSSTDGDVLFVRGYHMLWWTEAIYTSLDASVQFVMSTASRNPTLLRLATGFDPHRAWDVEIGADWRRDSDFAETWDFFARLRWRF